MALTISEEMADDMNFLKQTRETYDRLIREKLTGGKEPTRDMLWPLPEPINERNEQ